MGSLATLKVDQLWPFLRITCNLEGKGWWGSGNVNHHLISFQSFCGSEPLRSDPKTRSGASAAIVSMLILSWCYFITLESAEGVGAVGWGCDHFALSSILDHWGKRFWVGWVGGLFILVQTEVRYEWVLLIMWTKEKHGRKIVWIISTSFLGLSQQFQRRDLVFQFGKATIHKSHTYQIVFCFVFESRFALLLQWKRHLTSLLVIEALEVTSERKKWSQAMHQLFFRFSSPCFNSELTIANKLQSFDHAVPPEPWRMRAVPRKWQVPWSLPSPEEHTPRSWLWSKLLQPYTSCTIVH